jgi:hypothetical protein
MKASDSRRSVGETMATVIRKGHGVHNNSTNNNNNSNSSSSSNISLNNNNNQQPDQARYAARAARPQSARARVESTPGRLTGSAATALGSKNTRAMAQGHTVASYHNIPPATRDRQRPMTSRMRNKPVMLLAPHKEVDLVIGESDMAQARHHVSTIERLNATLGKPLALAPRRQSPRSPRHRHEAIGLDKAQHGSRVPGSFSPFHHSPATTTTRSTRGNKATDKKHTSKRRLTPHLHVYTGDGSKAKSPTGVGKPRNSSPAGRLVSPRPRPFSAWSKHEQSRAQRPPVRGFASITDDRAPFISPEERRVADEGKARARWVGGAATPFRGTVGVASTSLRHQAGITWDGPYLPPAHHDFRDLKSPRTPWLN